MQRLEARLKKLRVDEEKTNKHIQEALKQQEFVQAMKNEKQKALESKLAYQSYM